MIAIEDPLVRMIRERCLRRGSFTLSSGRVSDHYFDLRPLLLSTHGLKRVAVRVRREVVRRTVEAVAGMELAAVPIVAATVMGARGPELSGAIVRKAPKDHGTGRLVESGRDVCGLRTLVVEDVATTGASALRAAAALREEGAIVVAVLAVLDREEGALEACAVAGIPFSALTRSSDILRERNRVAEDPGKRLEKAYDRYWKAKTPDEEKAAYQEILRLGGKDGYRAE